MDPMYRNLGRKTNPRNKYINAIYTIRENALKMFAILPDFNDSMKLSF